MSTKCGFDLAWAGPCKAETGGGRCERHAGVKCQSCGAPASRECDYTGQFVCGYPLCDQCEGWQDDTKPSGAWGFINHGHRRKPVAEPEKQS